MLAPQSAAFSSRGLASSLLAEARGHRNAGPEEQRPGRNRPSLLPLCSPGCQPRPPAWPLPPSAARGPCSLPAPVTGLQPTSQECLLPPLGGWFPPAFEGQLWTPHSPTPSPTCKRPKRQRRVPPALPLEAAVHSQARPLGLVVPEEAVPRRPALCP
ncbi:ESX-1 secretion-associated protein EspI-like [Physeter macrocephalus]|uniref:ESX-1 secretion-associated protein EspI-like n=1 Tax=Physeter macrocephalus TaxID=9755 RepID=A0A455ANI6_PHYMC|nr:ESX-1 secretion-associated protein EspI-like [Physeter catodon]|eukprot:XP_028338235.1 uncharacterized protein LOC112062408 [Physeter catodon]